MELVERNNVRWRRQKRLEHFLYNSWGARIFRSYIQLDGTGGGGWDKASKVVLSAKFSTLIG